MFKKIIGWIVLVPLCAILILFALANRHLVPLNFNPFMTIEPMIGGGVPLFLVIYAVLLIGVLLGGIATWFTQAHHRSAERHWRREAQALSSEIEAGRHKQATPQSGRALSEVDDLMDIR